ncbi:GMC oxidoreductase [Modestobacter altitudinis]|uniref:GMC oxidoreductase n=1 Tax=Modestobacter altitudinis TaxID=2213158 RepID=UPI001C5558CA|nr:GMC oxidoreductase [Modestobacter altitudinis]
MLVTSAPSSATADVCVVGAGPVGLALALEAADSGLHVLLVEAGGADSAVAPTDSATAVVLDADRHAPLSETTRRGIGGTSWLWGGRCVPFEPLDLAARDHVAGSGWPISSSDVTPAQDRAAAYLDCGPADFHVPVLPGWDDTVVRTSQQERWSRRPHLGRQLGARVLAHPAISVLTDAVATDIRFDATGTTVSGLVVRHRNRDVLLGAGRYVLACGGLATTRLLLSVQRARPESFGGIGGPLGRRYMGHITGSIAALQLSRPADVRDWDFRRDVDGTYVRRRFSFSEAAQRGQRLLNTSFYLGNLAFHDARHGSGALSLLALALASPPLGRRLAGAETRRRNTGARLDVAAHLRNIGRRPWRVVADLAGVVRRRYLSSPRFGVFVLRTDTGLYALRYHAEQAPDPRSRVSLRGDTGPDGLPTLDIDFRYTDQDVDSVLRAHELLDEQLRASGLGRLVYLTPDGRRRDAVIAQATDGYHQIGTTPMSADPAAGVVDPDCRVHGLANLYVAGSSVFPTSGEANPTFMAVTLAVRLAQHLAALAQSRRPVGTPSGR